MSDPHFSHTLRVYYEDTDAGGIVYYANYLRFLERARTEALRSLGFEHVRMHAEEDLVFVVRSVSADYQLSAKLDDLIEIHTTATAVGRASLRLIQRVVRDGACLVDASVTIVCVKHSLMKPAPWPSALYARLKALP